MDLSPHCIAHELARQLAVDDKLLSSAVPLFGASPLFYLDDDDPEDHAPHIVVTPDTSDEGIGTDGDIKIRLTASAHAAQGEDIATPDGGTPGLMIWPSAAKFDIFAREVWEAVKRANPGAILDGHTAEWSFGDFYPLHFVVYTLNYRTIQAFGD